MESAFKNEEKIHLIFRFKMARNTRANKYQQLLEERAKLPVYNYKEQFLKLLDENQCLILSGNI
jgi:HrpA-like RNA helicase